MSSRECKDDKGVIYDIDEGDKAVRFDGEILTVIGELGYDHSGCFFGYIDPTTKQHVWDYARNVTWIDGEKPKCRWCGEELTMHRPTGLWTSARDVSTGYCSSNPLRGQNISGASHHMLDLTKEV